MDPNAPLRAEDAAFEQGLTFACASDKHAKCSGWWWNPTLRGCCNCICHTSRQYLRY